MPVVVDEFKLTVVSREELLWAIRVLERIGFRVDGAHDDPLAMCLKIPVRSGSVVLVGFILVPYGLMSAFPEYDRFNADVKTASGLARIMEVWEAAANCLDRIPDRKEPAEAERGDAEGV